jgi:hypothetical protein
VSMDQDHPLPRLPFLSHRHRVVKLVSNLILLHKEYKADVKVHTTPYLHCPMRDIPLQAYEQRHLAWSLVLHPPPGAQWEKVRGLMHTEPRDPAIPMRSTAARVFNQPMLPLHTVNKATNQITLPLLMLRIKVVARRCRLSLRHHGATPGVLFQPPDEPVIKC